MKLLLFPLTFLPVLFLIFPMTTNAAQTATPPPACTSEQQRAFDFWIGEWEVTAKGKKKPHAKSSITRANNGCSIHERYSTQSGYTGNSLNFYDAVNKKWHQTWIDNQGAALYLDGQFINGKMILSDGKNKITWRRIGKTVNQVWEVTGDNGKTWKTIFDGIYRPQNK